VVLLEEDDVEDVVEDVASSLGRKPQPIGNRAYLLDHLEGPVEAWRELGLGAVSDAGRGALMETKLDPVVHLERQVPVEFVMGRLHVILRLK